MDPKQLENKAIDYFAENVNKAKDRGDSPISQRASLITALSVAAVPALIDLIERRIGPQTIGASILTGLTSYGLSRALNKSLQHQIPSEYIKAKMAHAGMFEKEAGVVGGALKFVGRGVKDFGRGLVAPVFKKGMPLSERALSVGSKAIAGYGAYKAGKAIYNQSRKPDYVTYLRNQTYAGNISPQELSADNIDDIRKISSLKGLAGLALPVGFTMMSGYDSARKIKQPVFQAAKSIPQRISMMP